MLGAERRRKQWKTSGPLSFGSSGALRLRQLRLDHAVQNASPCRRCCPLSTARAVCTSRPIPLTAAHRRSRATALCRVCPALCSSPPPDSCVGRRPIGAVRHKPPLPARLVIVHPALLRHLCPLSPRTAHSLLKHTSSNAVTSCCACHRSRTSSAYQAVLLAHGSRVLSFILRSSVCTSSQPLHSHHGERPHTTRGAQA